MQLWILVALLGAFSKAVFGSYQKHLTDSYDKFQLSYVTAFVAFIVFIPISGWEIAHQQIQITPSVALAFLVKGGLGVVSLLAVFRAYQTTDFSVFVPLVRVSPLFIALLEPLFFPTQYRPAILMAAVLGVFGAYIVMLEDNGWLEPVRRMTERGPQLAVFVALCSTGGSLATRYAGIESVPPGTFAVGTNLIMVVALAALLHQRNHTVNVVNYLNRDFNILGVLGAIREYLIIVAYSLAIAARVSLVFQLGIIFSVLIGGTVFEEEHLGKRLIGSVLIVVSVLIVSGGLPAFL